MSCAFSIFRGMSTPAEVSHSRCFSRSVSHFRTSRFPNVGTAIFAKRSAPRYSTNETWGTVITFSLTRSSAWSGISLYPSTTRNASGFARGNASWNRTMSAPWILATATAAREAPFRRGSQSPGAFGRKDFRETPARTGRPRPRSSPRPRRSSAFCSGVLPKPNPGSMMMASREIPSDIAAAICRIRNVRTSATTSSYFGSSCIVTGSPRMCMITAPAPEFATTRFISMSMRPRTSFTITAPARIAFRAISGLYVSTEIGTSSFRSIVSITFAILRHSSPASTGGAPGRVDSPPTSRMSAPSSARRSAWATAGSSVKCSPPSENESGVTFTIPITRVRSSSHSTSRARRIIGLSPIGFAIPGPLFKDGLLWGRTVPTPAMRVLFLHCDLLEYEVKEKALPSAEDLPPEKRKGRIEDALVCFISAEKEDELDVEGIAEEAVRNIEEVAAQVKATRVAIYPYAHLSSSLAASGPAKTIFALLEERLRKSGFQVLSSPFGYYKSFKVSVKGHPLSELSREIHPAAAARAKDDVSEAVKAEQKLVSEWFILEPNGTLHPLRLDGGKVAGFDFAGHENLQKFASYEMAKSREAKEEPPHVRLMRELELVDYEPGSDPGNLRFYAKGRLIKGLLEEFVTRRVTEYGAMEVESPVMYDFEHPALKSYLDRFPARQYVVQTPNKTAFLRFSACFGQFLIAHDMVISYKQLPLSLYEMTRYSFRAEQRGEVAGLRRLRAFTMPDSHALVSDVGMAEEKLMVRFEVAWKLLQDCGLSIPPDFEVGVRVTKAFWDANKDFVAAYAKRWGKPILVEMWSDQFFYFVMKYEWNFVDANDKAE